MKHLTDTELLDAIESPQRSPAHGQHLQQCVACRREADALRAVRAAAAEDRMPDPSPLFWDHFSARVSAAVRAESIAPEAPPWFSRLQRPLATWAVVAAAAVLVILTVVWRATLHAPATPGTMAPTVAVNARPAPDRPLADNPDADERWAVVRAAAEDIAWEDVHEAGISAVPGSAEGVALELTADERLELARLLDHEMKRNGV
jgi:hypothetical protein